MGRFKKLETDNPDTVEATPADNAYGLRRILAPKPAQPDSVHPEYDQGHYHLEGDKHFFQGDYKAALRCYSRAVQADHSRPDPWVGQLLTLVMMKQKKEATIWMIRSLEQFPEEPRLLALQSLIYALTGFQQRSLAANDYLLTRPNAGIPFTWAIRAHILSIAESPNATGCFQKFEEFAPAIDWKTYAVIGLLQLENQKWNRAKDYLEKAVSQNNSIPFIWRKLAFACERLAFTEQALQAYRSALELNPNDRDAETGIIRLKTTPLPVRIWRRLFKRSQ